MRNPQDQGKAQLHSMGTHALVVNKAQDGCLSSGLQQVVSEPGMVSFKNWTYWRDLQTLGNLANIEPQALLPSCPGLRLWSVSSGFSTQRSRDGERQELRLLIHFRDEKDWAEWGVRKLVLLTELAGSQGSRLLSLLLSSNLPLMTLGGLVPALLPASVLLACWPGPILSPPQWASGCTSEVPGNQQPSYSRSCGNPPQICHFILMLLYAHFVFSSCHFYNPWASGGPQVINMSLRN